ncbi:MAG: helix-turn-helix transcriptional regulator [Bacteroidota bacterium]|nr:helix-turn-helix transcriptional regulator [Bacteroidota bacterium]
MFTGDEIRAKRKALRLTAEALAEILGVNKDNIYKWEKGTRPNGEDYVKVESWLSSKTENIPLSLPGKNKPQATENSKYTDDYIALLKQRVESLEAELEEVKADRVSLRMLLEVSGATLAYQKVFFDYAVEVGAAGNSKKASDLRQRLGKLLAEKVGGGIRVDTSVG